MSDLGYVNARLRAQRARRLADRQLEALSTSADLEALCGGLSGTPYGEALSESQAGTNLPAVDRAISSVLQARIDHVIRLLGKEEETLPFTLYLSRVHVQNLKVVLRAVQSGAGFEAAWPALVPLSPLDRPALEELCSQEDLLGVARELMTWGVALGQTLAKAIRQHADGDSLVHLDRALDEAYFAKTLHALLQDDVDSDGQSMIDALKDEIDLFNLRSALKVSLGGGGEFPGDPIPHGRIPDDVLKRISTSGSLGEAVTLLDRTVYHQALEEGISEAAGRGDLGRIERILESLRLRRLSSRAAGDPLGLGFALRFLAEIDLEAQNLRLAARASAGLIPASVAQEAMIHV